MKISGMLGGLFMLFVIIHGLDDVSVTCSEFWLRVQIRRIPYVDSLIPQIYELYLGSGCPANRVLPSFFEFIYTLTSCGIRKYDSPWGILIESSVTYEPVFLNIRGYTEVTCTIQREFPFTFVPKEIENQSSASEETSQGLVEKKNSASSQVENLGPHQEVSFGNRVVCPLLDYYIFIPWS